MSLYHLPYYSLDDNQPRQDKQNENEECKGRYWRSVRCKCHLIRSLWTGLTLCILVLLVLGSHNLLVTTIIRVITHLAERPSLLSYAGCEMAHTLHHEMVSRKHSGRPTNGNRPEAYILLSDNCTQGPNRHIDWSLQRSSLLLLCLCVFGGNTPDHADEPDPEYLHKSFARASRLIV
jgi:hypothetical protein